MPDAGCRIHLQHLESGSRGTNRAAHKDIIARFGPTAHQPTPRPHLTARRNVNHQWSVGARDISADDREAMFAA
jgi:hypothetical protein